MSVTRIRTVLGVAAWLLLAVIAAAIIFDLTAGKPAVPAGGFQAGGLRLAPAEEQDVRACQAYNAATFGWKEPGADYSRIAARVRAIHAATPLLAAQMGRFAAALAAHVPADGADDAVTWACSWLLAVTGRSW